MSSNRFCDVDFCEPEDVSVPDRGHLYLFKNIDDGCYYTRKEDASYEKIFCPDAIASSAIDIPTPLVKVGKLSTITRHPDLFAEYIPFSEGADSFAAHSPKYYLFMARSAKTHKKKIHGVKTVVKRSAGFFHPTHLQGINFPPKTHVYGGTTAIPLHTEFPIPLIGPYVKTLLGFNPYEFARFRAPGPGIFLPLTPAELIAGVPLTSVRIQGGKSNQTKHSSQFAIAIGITNPNAADTTHPILFGNLSKPFRLTFGSQYGDSGKIAQYLVYSIQNSGVKRNIPVI